MSILKIQIFFDRKMIYFSGSVRAAAGGQASGFTVSVKQSRRKEIIRSYGLFA